MIIDNKKIKIKSGQTVLEAARDAGLEIPALCHHPDLDIKASCRLCLIEIKGKKGMFPACSTGAEENMEVITDSPAIRRARRINLELIFTKKADFKLLEFAKKYRIKLRFAPRKKNWPFYKFGPALFFDSSKCIDCRNCFDVCQKQGVGFLETRERGHCFSVVPSPDKKRDCVYCGQCILRCPVAAMGTVSEIKGVERALKDKNKFVIFQFAPSVRTSIGEEFNLPYGRALTGKLAGAIKKLGADRVFDTSVGADFTTFEEAGELLEKLKKKNTPCLSSCCPAWVKFLEFYYPEFVPYLATTRSPQTILGGLIKTYFADKEKRDPKKIVVVSIMPCVAKKYEIRRPELKIRGLMPVDYVLTTRELAFLLKKRKIDFKKVPSQKTDNPLGMPSGGGIIYGASGGVAESVLRTAYETATGKKLAGIDFKEVRGMAGIKKAEIAMNGRSVKIAVVNGLGNARKILEELKKNPKAYDALEVMACWGGCIGGGGQPLPVDGKIREERASGLYGIDAKKTLRKAHENPVLKQVYKDFLTSQDKIHLICHTKYFPKKKEVKFLKTHLCNILKV